MNNALSEFIKQLEMDALAPERLLQLDPLIHFIQAKKDANEFIHLHFICTHNSRRSHLCQVWAQTMAAYFKVQDVTCYSGGTEATAVYSMIIQTFVTTGFKVLASDDTPNPLVTLHYSDVLPPMHLFSKTYDDAVNPSSHFAAVMTCDDADANCPTIPNATRISVTYNDPKASDGTAEQAHVYAARSRQIATEMKYVFAQLK